MTYRLILIALLLTSCSHKNPAINFASKIDRLETKIHSQIGVSAVHIESGESIEYNADERFKMASTSKLPVAIYLLNQVQHHKISLNTMIKIEPQDLVPGSGLMGYYLTRPGLAMSMYNILEPMITISENSSNDIILSRIGGTKAVRHFLYEKGINDIWIDRPLMQQFLDCKAANNLLPRKEWSLQKWKVIFDGLDPKEQSESYRLYFSDMKDTTTPKAMTGLLVKLYKKELLNKEYTALMLEIMGRTSASDRRIKALLPKEAKVAHKSGSWNQKQLDAFYNYTHDVGIITLPNEAGHVAISVYTGSHAGSTQALQSDAIAKAAKMVYDHFK